jgi:putative ABC transport system permease protein
MLFYQIKIAWLSIRRNPVLAGLLVVAIALGVTMSTASLAAYSTYASNPIPEKSDQLFYVELDSWEKDKPFDKDAPHKPPPMITYMDMLGIMQSDIPTRQSGITAVQTTVQPEGNDPFTAVTRLCFSDFFDLFEVPFAYGSGWDRAADQSPEPVVVIDAETSQKLFGGTNSVGRTISLNSHPFTIVGVLEPWRPIPKFYDPHGSDFAEAPAAIFMPLAWLRQLQLDRFYGSMSCRGRFEPNLEGRLGSECVWIEMWVQLDSQAQKQAYLAFLDAYVKEQKKLGRFPRPLNNRLLSVMELLRDRQAVPEESKTLVLLSLLLLVVCSVNLIGILLGKFLARAPEVGVRRALGATKRSVFIQHLVECELVGLLGGGLGLVLSSLVLRFLNRELDNHGLFTLDAKMVLAAFALSMVAGLIAGIYPTWRICRAAPASFLKFR